MPRVVVVGDANVDIIVPYPRFLDESHHLVKWPSIDMQGGGTAANTAVALSKLDVPVSMVGTVGEDHYGSFVMNDLSSSGVDTSEMIVDRDTVTVGVFAFVDDRGERYLWGWPREKQSFKVLDAGKISYEHLCQADWLHSSGMVLTYDTSARSTITEMFKIAHNAGVRTSFDLNLRVDDGVLDSDFEMAVNAILPYVDYVFGSGPEEFAYMGEGSWLENAKNYAHGRVVIVRDGECGSIGLRGEECINTCAYDVAVEDTIGAGDAYNAGFIAACLQGSDLSEALQWGNAVSAYKVERRGARSTPSLSELKGFMKAHVLHHEVLTR